jgi:hypothetical protein
MVPLITPMVQGDDDDDVVVVVSAARSQEV